MRGKREKSRTSPRRAPKLSVDTVSTKPTQTIEPVPTPQRVVVTGAHDTSPSGIPVCRSDRFSVGVLAAECAAPFFRFDKLLDTLKVELERARGGL